MNETARKRTIYQDPYNSMKTWEVTELNGGYYLKQFISGKQFGRGLRTTKKHLKEIGIFEMSCIKVIDNWKEESRNTEKRKLELNRFYFTNKAITRMMLEVRRALKEEKASNKRLELKEKHAELVEASKKIFVMKRKYY